MAEATAARREARRKRILENSHNRLQLIAGKSDDDFLKESSIRQPSRIGFPIPNQSSAVIATPKSNSSFVLSSNYTVFSNPESHNLLPRIRNHESAVTKEVEVVNTASLPPKPEPPQATPLWQKLITYRYDIVIVSLLIQIVQSLYPDAFEVTYFFLPVLAYILTKLIYFPKGSQSNLANMFMLLNGISAGRVQRIINISMWVGEIMQDILVFLFTTICIQSLLSNVTT